MNKKELIRAISYELDPPISQDKITLILDKAVEITKRTLATGEPVKWAGFGSFVMKDVLLFHPVGEIYHLQRLQTNHVRSVEDKITDSLLAKPKLSEIFR